MLRKILRTVKREILWRAPKKMAHSVLYFHMKKKFVNWKELPTFDERMHWLMVYEIDEKYAVYADKYKVREYIKKIGLEHILIKLYGVYDSYKEVDINRLPDKFIMKGNNGSGTDYYAICENKATFNLEREGEKIQNAIKANYSKKMCEYHYASIDPKIVIEEYLCDGKHERLIDYKFYCFQGEPKVVLVCSDRAEGCKRRYYDMEWNDLKYAKNEYVGSEEIERPETLKEMINLARTISKEFPFVRVDFYEVNGKVYFGEMTFTGAAGNSVALTEKGQIEMGKMLVLPSKEK